MNYGASTCTTRARRPRFNQVCDWLVNVDDLNIQSLPCLYRKNLWGRRSVENTEPSAIEVVERTWMEQAEPSAGSSVCCRRHRRWQRLWQRSSFEIYHHICVDRIATTAGRLVNEFFWWLKPRTRFTRKEGNWHIHQDTVIRTSSLACTERYISGPFLVVHWIWSGTVVRTPNTLTPLHRFVCRSVRCSDAVANNICYSGVRDSSSPASPGMGKKGFAFTVQSTKRVVVLRQYFFEPFLLQNCPNNLQYCEAMRPCH